MITIHLCTAGDVNSHEIVFKDSSGIHEVLCELTNLSQENYNEYILFHIRVSKNFCFQFEGENLLTKSNLGETQSFSKLYFFIVISCIRVCKELTKQYQNTYLEMRKGPLPGTSLLCNKTQIIIKHEEGNDFV